MNCIVEDDGVGISITKITEKENKSLGMRITEERIDVMNKLKNANASINVFNKNKGVRQLLPCNAPCISTSSIRMEFACWGLMGSSLFAATGCLFF